VENKFTANIDTLDSFATLQHSMRRIARRSDRGQVPGCALHHAVGAAVVGRRGSGTSHLTFELQLKTFPSMISSDLYHNVVYKSLLPQTSASMADTIRRYAWENVYDELKGFYTSQLNVEHVLSCAAPLPPEEQVVRTCSRSVLSSKHFKRKSLAAKQATDNTSLIQQLLNSTTYSGNLKLHLVDVNSVYDLLLAATTTTPSYRTTS